MFVRTLVLVAFATVAQAGPYGKPTLKAVAKANVVPDDDGVGFQINLDGTDSDRKCANGRWEIIECDDTVKIIRKRLLAHYDTPDIKRTYTFKLVLWDPDIPERTDSDTVSVTVPGKNVPQLPIQMSNVPGVADADVVKVEETENGYMVFLTGMESKNCEDYTWEYKTSDGYVAFGANVNATYEVFRPGKHKFRLTCIHENNCAKYKDVTFVRVFKCRKPKYPRCEGKYPEARAIMSKCEENDGKTIVSLTAANSENCDTYSWWRIRKNQANEFLGTGMTKEYPVNNPKVEMKFKLKCHSNACDDDDKDVIETTCDLQNNPCDNIRPDPKARITKVKRAGKRFTIYLSAKGSRKCNRYRWFLVQEGKDKYIGKGRKQQFKTKKFGKYEFRVQCVHSRCNKRANEFVDYRVRNPCRKVAPKANAAIKEVKKVNGKWRVTLTARGSKDCDSYEWKAITEESSDVIGTKKTITHTISKPGSYVFKVTCKNKKCNKKDRDYTSHSIEDPCKRIHPEVVAKVNKVVRSGGKWHITLVAEGRSKSTRLNSSHITISYAVFCLKKKKNKKKHKK